jgi:hypothetical protein
MVSLVCAPGQTAAVTSLGSLIPSASDLDSAVSEHTNVRFIDSISAEVMILNTTTFVRVESSGRDDSRRLGDADHVSRALFYCPGIR